MSAPDQNTAWLPFDSQRGQTDDALALAIEWVEHECAGLGAVGLLVLPRKSLGFYASPIEDFARRHAWTSRRGAVSGRARDCGPVLVHCPGYEELEYADLIARRAPLCVTEWPDVPLKGWAAARGTVDLGTDELTQPPGDEAVKLLEHLHFAGNNGWFDAPGKRDARRLIAELAEVAPECDGRYIAAYMLGLGNVTAQSAENVVKLASEHRR